jgi:RNA-directed DNA polymerase
MSGIKNPESISTKQARIANIARQRPDQALTPLSHHIDLDWLREAHRRTRKDAAPGVDEQTAADYEKDLEANLQSLLDRAKSGTYRAPPVRRVDIPKGDGKTRPIGIPTHEDKVLQRAVVMVLEPVYEQEFFDFSYGFRPGRSAHQALETLWRGLMNLNIGWVLDVDVQSFFDTLDHRVCRDLLRERVSDGVIARLVGKWLNAGVLEGGVKRRLSSGTPQGGVISPLLANIYLHHVLDKWWTEEVLPRLRGRAILIRYADDFVIGFELEEDARRVHAVLPKRFGKYGLTLHPDKTRLLRFGSRSEQNGPRGSSGGVEAFDFLGFTHHWGKTKKGTLAVQRRTMRTRFSRALRAVSIWCRQHRHMKVAEQAQHLARKLLGHYAYYGITGNMRALSNFRQRVLFVWLKWLCRRSQRARMTWDVFFKEVLKKHPLPEPRIVRSSMRTAKL